VIGVIGQRENPVIDTLDQLLQLGEQGSSRDGSCLCLIEQR
jgi:hypothetical protein